MAAASIFVGLAGATACSDYDPLDWDVLVEREAQAFKESGIFDFSTTRDVTLSLDYGAPTASNPVWVYTEYPYDGEGALRPDVDADCAFFLSGGRFEGTLSLPASAERVYIVTGGIGLPGLTVGTVQGGAVTFSRSLTRTIETANSTYSYTTGATEVVLADFADAAWDGLKTKDDDHKKVSFGSITVYNQDKISLTGERVTYEGGPTWTRGLSTGGISIFLNGSTLKAEKDWERVIKIDAPTTAGTLKVYFSHSNANANDKRGAEIYKATSESTVTLIGSKYITRPDDDVDGIAEVTLDGTEGTLYVTAYSSVIFHGIIFTQGHTTGYLSPSDYSYTSATASDLVTRASTLRGDITGAESYEQEYDDLVVLYPWSISGRPLFGQTTTSRYNGTEYHYSFSYDNSGTIAGNGITVTNDNPVQHTTEREASPRAYYWAKIDGKELEYRRTWSTTSTVTEGDAVTISNVSAGTVTLYFKGKDTKATIFVNGISPTYSGPITNELLGKESEEYPSADQVWKVVFDFTKASRDGVASVMEATEWALRTYKSTLYLLYMTYTDKDENGKEQTHKGYFDANGLVEVDDDGTVVTDEDKKWFSFSQTNTITQCKSGSNIKTEKVPSYITYGGQQYSYALSLDHERDKENAEKLTFDIPAGTQARLTVVQEAGVHFHLTTGTTSGGTIVDTDITDESSDVYVTTLDAERETLHCTISRGDADKNVYLVTVDYVDDYAGTVEQAVLKYPNVDDQPLNAIEAFEDVKQRLFNTLWRQTGSKANAKAQYGEYFNDKYTRAEENKNNIEVVGEEGAKLFVTFLGEYDQTSANTFGYYYYDALTPPSSPDGLKKFIVFPNCTSDVYATGRKYKEKPSGSSVYDYTGDNDQFVPLHSGDQVQLMYYDEATGDYVETFPKGTVVGWFVIYNSFDTWNLQTSGSGKLQSGKVRLGEGNNINGDKTPPDTKIYYSNPGWNTSDGQEAQARCIQFTDPETKAVSICFEDSYSTLDGHSGSQDKTYDDLIVLLSADPSPRSSIRNRADQDVESDTHTYLSFNQRGIYVFEDIWEGGKTIQAEAGDEWDYRIGTDYDMNDVAVRYTRTFTVVKGEATATKAASDGPVENKLVNIKEGYTLVNDGATYTDGFAVRLPYKHVAKVTVNKYAKDGKEPIDTWELAGSELKGKAPILHETAAKAKGENKARIEYDATDDVLTLVLFDDINAMSEGDNYEVVYEFEEANRPSLFYTQSSASTSSQQNGTIAESDLTKGKFQFGRDAYNPFIIVYEYGLQDGRRSEIHLPGKNPSNVGRVAGADQNAANNRWYVARITGLKSGDTYMPFALDLDDPDFVAPREGELITDAYPKFLDWAKSKGEKETKWYSKTDAGYRKTEIIGWEWVGE